MNNSWFDEKNFYDCAVNDKKGVLEVFKTIEQIMELLGRGILDEINIKNCFNLSTTAQEMLTDIGYSDDKIDEIYNWFNKIRTILCMDGINIHRVVMELEKESKLEKENKKYENI